MHKSGLAKKILLALGLPLMAGAQTFHYWDVTAPDSLKLTPALLSQTGMYTGTTIQNAKKTLLPNIVKFEVNSALWSDGAHKTRWVMLKAGTNIRYKEEDDYWGYPDSAVFIKQFAIDTVPGDTTTRLLWETRFIVNKKEFDSTAGVLKDKWHGYSYKWDRDGKDARLVVIKGANDSLKVFPQGKNKPGVMKKWQFPSREKCANCHRMDYTPTLHGRSVLGFFTAQLNRPSPNTPNVNQLEDLFNKGILSGFKSVWNASTTPRWYGIDDTTASVDIRARSYIAANCSGCHGERGMENGATFGVDLNYDFHNMDSKMEFRHKPVSWPFGLDTVPPAFMPQTAKPPFFYPRAGDANNPFGKDSVEILPALVVPGYPEKSVILFRQISRNTELSNYDPDRNQMPPLASFEVNKPATDLIFKWIKEWTPLAARGSSAIRTHAVRTNLKGPGIQGKQVVLPMELAGPGRVAVTLTGITGRTVELRQLSRTAYALPDQLTPGVYIIKVNSVAYTRYLF
jgi:hypothetical protein